MWSNVMYRWCLLLLFLSSPAMGAVPGDYREQLKKGWEHVQLYEFERAIPIFKKLQREFPEGSEEWIQMTFATAVCYEHQTPPSKETVQESRRLFWLLAEKYPRHACAARALLNVARIDELRNYYLDRIDLESARKLYQKVTATYPGTLEASEAVLRLAQSYTNTFNKPDVETGVKILEDWLRDHPKDPLAGIMSLLLGDVYFYPLAEYDKCVKAYMRADELKSLEPGKEGYTYWRIARVAQDKLKNKDIAVKYYTKIIMDTPTFAKGFQSQLALKELGAPVPELQRGSIGGRKRTTTAPAGEVRK